MLLQGVVVDEDEEQLLHKVVYDDEAEELLSLGDERFRLLAPRAVSAGCNAELIVRTRQPFPLPMHCWPRMFVYLLHQCLQKDQNNKECQRRF